MSPSGVNDNAPGQDSPARLLYLDLLDTMAKAGRREGGIDSDDAMLAFGQLVGNAAFIAGADPTPWLDKLRAAALVTHEFAATKNTT